MKVYLTVLTIRMKLSEITLPLTKDEEEVWRQEQLRVNAEIVLY